MFDFHLRAFSSNNESVLFLCIGFAQDHFLTLKCLNCIDEMTDPKYKIEEPESLEVVKGYLFVTGTGTFYEKVALALLIDPI